jgi:hypothetical protein
MMGRPENMDDETRSLSSAERAAEREKDGSTTVGAGDTILDGFINLLLTVLGAAFFAAARTLLHWVWTGLKTGAAMYGPKIIVVGALLALALVLYVFRDRKPKYYGLVEIGFGITMGINALFSHPAPNGADTISNQSMQMFLGATGAVYLIVRGMDNATKPRRDVREKRRIEAEIAKMIEASKTAVIVGEDVPAVQVAKIPAPA